MFAASAFRKLSSVYVFSYFPFGFEGRIWDLIVSVPDHCLYFYCVSHEVKVSMTYISRSSDFVLYLEEYLMYVHHTLGV